MAAPNLQKNLVNSETEQISKLIASGNLAAVQTSLKQTFPSITKDELSQHSSHSHSLYSQNFDASTVCDLLNTASRYNQPAIFAFIWDECLVVMDPSPRIPWASLRDAAIQGSVSLAEVFYARDPEFFKILQPAAPHGSQGGGSQMKIAIRSDNFEYVDFLLEKGADINAGGPKQSPVKEALRSAAGDLASFKRIRFLVERGAAVAGTGSLEEVIDRPVFLQYLLDHGKCTEEDVGKALLAAQEEQRDDAVKALKRHMDECGMELVVT